MILKGLSQEELQGCLDRANEIYDGNIIFNVLEERLVFNTSGIKTTNISGVIVAKVDNNPYIIYANSPLNHGKTNKSPFFKNEKYEITTHGKHHYVCLYKGKNYISSHSTFDPKEVISLLAHKTKVKDIHFTLRTKDCRGPGSQYTNNRKTIALCWHGHRDIMKEIFEVNPEARITTAVAYYKGKEHFYEMFEGTYNRHYGTGTLYGQYRYCDC